MGFSCIFVVVFSCSLTEFELLASWTTSFGRHRPCGWPRSRMLATSLLRLGKIERDRSPVHRCPILLAPSHSLLSLAHPQFSPAHAAATATCQPWWPAHHRRSPVPPPCSFLLAVPPSHRCWPAARCHHLPAMTNSRAPIGVMRPRGQGQPQP